MKNTLLNLSRWLGSARLLGLLLIILTASGSTAHAQQRISIAVSDEPLESVFDIISNQSGYKFVYGDDYLKNTARITLNMRNATINEVMDACLRETGLGYRIEGREIIIVSPKLRPATEQDQNKMLQGYVYDQKGVPLIGASVVLVDTRRGVSTDVNGFFTIPIPGDGAAIRVSYLGMEQQVVLVRNETEITVTMKEDATSIDDVVVTAYGIIQKKEDLVGSAFQVNSTQIEMLPTVRIDRMLEGMVPGYSINAQSDSPEGRQRFSTRIRGESSLNAGGEPLWIVDGVRMYTGENTNMISGSQFNVSPLSLIDPNDIESVTVLKDATQTSLYGANGANGVVLITTKKGSKGAPKINASVKYGISAIDKSTKLKVLNGEQFLTLAREAWTNAGNSMTNFPWQDNALNTYSKTNTDWSEYFYGIGQTLDTHVSIRGGGERTSNYLSFGYFRDKPAELGNTTDRFSLRYNTYTDITKKLKLAVNFGFSYTVDNVFNVGNYYEFLPIISPYYEDRPGEYRLLLEKTNRDGQVGQYRFANTLAERDQNTQRNKSIKPIGRAELSYEIIKGLDVSADFGMDYSGYHNDIYYARTNLKGASWSRDPNDPLKLVYVPEGTAIRTQSNFLTWTSTEKISFSRDFGKHSVMAMAAIEFYNKDREIIYSSGRGFPNDKMREVQYSDNTKRTTYTNSDRVRNLSYLGLVNYSYDRRYYLAASYRRDGSSVFNEYKQWSQFYSIGGSWNIHNEKFFNVPVINNLRLSATYGNVGNSRVEGYFSNGVYTIGSNNSGYRGQLGGTMTEPATIDLTWETVYKTNLKLDIGLWRRLDLTLEYYNHKTVDMINELGLSLLTGSRKLYRNSGIMRNRGFEVSITSINIDTEDWRWTTSFNLSHNKNKVLELYEEAYKSAGEYGWYEGYEKNVYTLIRFAGVDPGDGSPLYYDKDGNLTKTYSYDNRVPLYDMSRYPAVQGGMTNSVRWKNFDLNVQLIYSIGGWTASSALVSGIDGDGKNLNDLSMASNVVAELLDRWQKPGDMTYMPVLIADQSRNTMSYNTRRLVNKTNVRIGNVSLSYRFPERILSKLSVQGARVSFIMDNPYIWTPYASRDRNSYKTLMSPKPSQRTFSLSLDINF